MANPDIKNPTSIYGKTTYITPSGTAAENLLTNSSGSNKILKTTTLIACNIDGDNNADCSVTLYDSATAGSGTGYPIISTVTIPFDSTVALLDKNSPIWIEEDRRIDVNISASGTINFILSYEELN